MTKSITAADVPQEIARILIQQQYLMAYDYELFINSGVNLPDLNGHRLHQAMNTVQAATRMQQLFRPTFKAKHDKIIQFCDKLSPKVKDNQEPFEFLVGGGFVVCEMLLGIDDWTDIDLWFVPQRTSDNAWLVLVGCSTYPTNVLTVSNIYEALTSFDLDICQCAIHFQWCQHELRARFLLSDSCVRALLCRSVQGGSFHPAQDFPRHLYARIEKYMSRGLQCRTMPWPEHFDTPHFKEEVQRQEHHARQAIQPLSSQDGTCGMWKVILKQNRISGLHFLAFPKSAHGSSTPAYICNTSKPGLLYPCQFLSDSAVNQIAYSQENLHWMFRLLASNVSSCAFARGANIRSNYIVPVWFLHRVHMTSDQICEEIRNEWTQLHGDNISPGFEKYVLLCATRVSQFTMMSDWKVRDYGDYGFRDGLYVDTAFMAQVEALMFCTESHNLLAHGSCCAHGCISQNMQTKFQDLFGN